MKTLLISDTAALAIMEARPEPAWRVRMTGLRNKDLLAPDYGAMHVVSSLKAAGREVRVVNLVADVHTEAADFYETNTDPAGLSTSKIAQESSTRASREYLFRTIEGESPDVIFVTLSTYNIALYTRQLLKDIKKACPGATLVTGGIYSTMHPDEVLGDGGADIVVRGEGELTAVELLERLEAGVSLAGLKGVSYRDGEIAVHNQAREKLTDLDTLPHPYLVTEEFRIKERFENLSVLLPHGDWIPGAGFLTSRGCPEACSFCLDPALNNKRTRFHSPAYVKEVLDFCSENFVSDARSFFFGDATFTMNKKRLRTILGTLAGLPYTYQIQTRADYLDRATIKGLADARFTTIALGAETFNEQILREVVRKRLHVSDILDAAGQIRENGMRPILTFIIGLPGETRESVLKTVEVLKAHKLYDSTFFPLVVFRGTALFEEFRDRVSPGEMDGLRLNPVSEEFLSVSDEFPTAAELTGFVEEVNNEIVSSKMRQ